MHHNAYGFMVIGSQAGHFNHNNFEDNDVNIGSAQGGISDEVADNYFAGAPFGDGTCSIAGGDRDDAAGPVRDGRRPGAVALRDAPRSSVV